MLIHRQIIKARDIQIYFGKSQSMSNKMLRQMRLALRKMPYQPIIIKEFCEYYNVGDDGIIEVIRSNDATKIENTVKSAHATSVSFTKSVDEPYQFQKKVY